MTRFEWMHFLRIEKRALHVPQQQLLLAERVGLPSSCRDLIVSAVQLNCTPTNDKAERVFSIFYRNRTKDKAHTLLQENVRTHLRRTCLYSCCWTIATVCLICIKSRNKKLKIKSNWKFVYLFRLSNCIAQNQAVNNPNILKYNLGPTMQHWRKERHCYLKIVFFISDKLLNSIMKIQIIFENKNKEWVDLKDWEACVTFSRQFL